MLTLDLLDSEVLLDLSDELSGLKAVKVFDNAVVVKNVELVSGEDHSKEVVEALLTYIL